MKYTLLLGSSSSSRQMLLRESKIPFVLIGQSADETHCDWGLTLIQVVTSIALYKMEHVIIPEKVIGDNCFVLTADTLSEDRNGTIVGKPTSQEDAIRMIREARYGMRTATAFCLERKKRTENGVWIIDKQIVEHAHAEYIFDVPEHAINLYLEQSSGFKSSGAIAIEGFGGQFLKQLSGSYSAVIGLPLFQLNHALHTIGFF